MDLSSRLASAACALTVLLGCEMPEQQRTDDDPAVGAVRAALRQPLTLPAELGPAPSPWPMRGQDAAHAARSSFAGPDTASIRWQTDLASGIISRGIKSSVAVGSDTVVYVGSQANRLHAVSALDGTELWAFRTRLLGSVESSPAVAADGTVYFGANDGRLYAVRPDGTLKWRFKTLGRVRSSPTIAAEGTVVFGSDDGRVYALTSDGELRWRFRTWAAVRSTPAVGFGGRVYVASNDTKLYALRLADGTKEWDRTLDFKASRSSPAIGLDGTVYVGSDARTLFAVNPRDGSLRWRFRSPKGAIRSSPAIGPDGTIYVGSDDGRLYSVRPDGTMKWSFRTGGAIRSSPAIGVEGFIYFGSNDGRMYALRDDEDRATPVWSQQLGAKIEGSPALTAGGTLYIGTSAGRLTAFARPAGGEAACLELVEPGCECICESCPFFFDICDRDPACTAIRSCAIETGCRGEECSAPATCLDVVERYGGPFGDGAVRGFLLSQCIASACPDCL